VIIPVWQPLFSSSHQIAKTTGKSRGEPATHTGTLDPLAQGVLIVLTGEDRFLKGQLNWPKTYEFQILWGVQTDSGDQLGIISESTPTEVSTQELETILSRFPTEYEQRIPDFSARRWKGQSAFDSAKRQDELPLKTRQVSLNSLTILHHETLSYDEVLAQQQKNVSQVEGDFRQEDILRNWQETFKSLPASTFFTITNHSVEVSPGTYIRQLVQDIAARVGVPATTWSIARTKNGQYDREKTLSYIK
jgi:tRNA pseudouridine55 synthase